MSASPASSSSRRSAVIVALVLGLALASSLSSSGCLDGRDAAPVAGDNCATCHGSSQRAGDPLTRSAPPFDTRGSEASAAVGAHLQHLMPNNIHGGVSCDECHIVPEATDAAGHADSALPAELTFGSLAAHGGVAPSYDPALHRCSTTYCHGGNDVGWEPSDAVPRCARCHGDPPPPPHPVGSDCSRCHGEVIDAQRSFIARERHVDGVVDVIGLTCTSCHGSGELGAPPPDVGGNTSVSALGVGAHQAHLTGGANSRPVACSACHTVPEMVGDPGHLDEALPADVIFGGVAVASNRAPAWDRDAASCTKSWCHGPTSSDASLSPAWTSEDGALGCTACHGTPPAPPHPQSDRCSACHGAVVDAGQLITVRDLHVDGLVQVTLPTTCNGCHGSDTSDAPPLDVTGNTETTAPGVGAHQIHLTTTNARPVPCNECHVVPTDPLSDGHADSALPAELAFGGIATALGATPIYSGGTCADTYCHGDNNNYGGSVTKPVWTMVDGSQNTCFSCHGLPPPVPHPNQILCWTCHSNIVNQSFEILAPMLHVNGQIDF